MFYYLIIQLEIESVLYSRLYYKKVLDMKLILLLLFTFFSFQSYADQWEDEDCGMKSKYEGKIFELTINEYLRIDGLFTFKFCKSGSSREKSFIVVKQFSSVVDLNNNKNLHKSIIKLTPQQTTIILDKFDKALEVNLKDKVNGLDGSQWCLDFVNIHTKANMCFWTPGYKSEERGLSGLHGLGNHLRGITGVQKKVI